MAAFLRIALAEKAADEKRAAEKAEAERLAAERARKAELIKQEEARVRALHRAAANWSVRAGFAILLPQLPMARSATACRSSLGRRSVIG